MAIIQDEPIERGDPRFETLKKGFNLRFPDEKQDAKSIYVCENEQQAVDALKNVVGAGVRPTIRSGGHCYEGFVSNNLGGAIIDVGLLTGVDTNVEVQTNQGPRTYAFRVRPGNQNWDAYLNLYKTHNRTLPAGSCYSVGAGGHICGGGYGLLSRLQGLTVDWVQGVDVLVVSKDGTGQKIVESVHANAQQNADLLKLCRGAGGGNVGIITSYYFDKLPAPPEKVAVYTLGIDWGQFDTSSKLLDFLNIYAQYFKNNDANKATWGLFSLLKLTHVTAKTIGLVIQYCDRNGTLEDMQPLDDFVNQFAKYQPQLLDVYLPGIGPMPSTPARRASGTKLGLPAPRELDWLYATQMFNGSGNNQRGKYKSSYMKDLFTQAEADALFKYLHDEQATNPDFNQSLVQIDSYGGAINYGPIGMTGFDPKDTAVPQRSSILKLQYQTYWTDSNNDADHLKWIGELFFNVYRENGLGGTPYPTSAALPNSRYEGCYINYPDVDMVRTIGATYNWGELYYPGIWQELVR